MGKSSLRIAKEATRFAEKFGIDALLFALLTVGAFTALGFGASGGWTFGITLVLVVGWVGNKFVDAHMRIKDAENHLKELQAVEGRKVLAKYEEQQGELPFGGGKHDR